MRAFVNNRVPCNYIGFIRLTDNSLDLIKLSGLEVSLANTNRIKISNSFYSVLNLGFVICLKHLGFGCKCGALKKSFAACIAH